MFGPRAICPAEKTVNNTLNLVGEGAKMNIIKGRLLNNGKKSISFIRKNFT